MYANRQILCLVSRGFKDMFIPSSDTGLNTVSDQPERFTIKGIQYKSFVLFMRYIYQIPRTEVIIRDIIEPFETQIFLELYYLASRYKVERLISDLSDEISIKF